MDTAFALLNRKEVAKIEKIAAFRLFSWEKPLTFLLNSYKLIAVVKANGFTQSVHKEGTSVKNQTFRMTMLFDFYGELLTERQKEFYQLYYDEDLSLGEIAENYGISRQGVRDVIVRAEAYMTEIEDKTGLVKRFMQFTPHVEAIESAANEIRKLNYRLFEDKRLEELVGTIEKEAAALKD